jgi:hypothetical protein
LTCPGLLSVVSAADSQPAIPRIAIIRPVFTAAAYHGYPSLSFYGFYKKYANFSSGMIVKTDLKLLNTSINMQDWGPSWTLDYFLQSQGAKDLSKNATILTDIDVNDGKLFDSASGKRRFSVAVLGFSEYVTLTEYLNYEHFVETGGGLFLLDGCNFVAEVGYHRSANTVSLVKGHGWEFNGTAAWPGPMHRWPAENTNWIGSNFALFHTDGYKMNGAIANTTHSLSTKLRTGFGLHVFSSYTAHEENAMTNSSDQVIAYWNVTHLGSKALTVAVYEHEYGAGTVIHTGVFGSDLIATDPCMQFLLTSSVGYLASRADSSNPVPEFQFTAIILVFVLVMSMTLYRKRQRLAKPH